MCLRVQEYVLSDGALVHTVDDVQEPDVHGAYRCALFILPMDANVTGGQAYELWSQEHA